MLDRFLPAGRVRERLRSAEYLGRRGQSFEVVQEYVRASAHFARWVLRQSPSEARDRRWR